MIEVNKISKEFIKNINKKDKVKFYANKDITFNAKSGEILGILGPNGAGKTTLLRIISGIMKPTSGSVSIDRLNYEESEIEIKKQIAFLSGNTKLYDDISPYELLKMCGDYYGVNKEKLDNRINEVANEFDIKDYLQVKFKEWG